MKRIVLLTVLTLTAASSNTAAWGPQGHRLVALVATNHLSVVAKQNVLWLLPDERLANVASWADQYLDGNMQTALWHYVNIPPEAVGYDRERDCPRQAGVAPGSRGDKWHDCVVDRVLYNQQRLGDRSLDRADRAIALKFLVHFVGDLHQPFHAISVQRGGNGIPVSAFGAETMKRPDGTVAPYNLHNIWDEALITHRGLDDVRYVKVLEDGIRQNHWDAQPIGGPEEWAVQSFLLAKAALLPPHANVDEAYYQAHIPTVDERLALAGLRLAALLNRTLTFAPR